MSDQDQARTDESSLAGVSEAATVATAQAAMPTEQTKVPVPPGPPGPPQTPMDRSRFSDEARKILKKANGLAATRNHGELLVAHLLLAMTLSPRARKLFEEEGADYEKVRRSCRRVLDAVPPEEDDPDIVMDTQDLKDAYVQAAMIAHKDLTSDDWQIFPRHLLEAVVRPPLADKFKNLITNEWPPSAAERALAINERIEKYFISEGPQSIGERSLFHMALRAAEASEEARSLARTVKIGVVSSLITGIAAIALIGYLIVR